MSDDDDVGILLVEDNHADADLTIRALRKSGFDERVHWLRDGVEALDFVQARGDYADRDRDKLPRLILLDLKMPRLNGLDVLRALKSDGITRGIPIVVMTSSAHQRDISESYRLGANGFVTKPIQFADLTTAVHHAATYWLRVNRVPQ